MIVKSMQSFAVSSTCRVTSEGEGVGEGGRLSITRGGDMVQGASSCTTLLHLQGAITSGVNICLVM